MTVEEALVIAETALDYERLNKVQEIIFRQAWEGRSYMEIAKTSGYEPDYIKDAGAKLWKLLSKAFGEKVKKDNLQSVFKRYSRRTQVSFHRNQVIEVNLSGADLTGANLSVANLSGARLITKLSEADFCQADLNKVIIPDNYTESDKDNNHQEITSNTQDKIHQWNGLNFRSDAEVKIAEILDNIGVLFLPNSKVRLTTTEAKHNLEVAFMICHQGKWGILNILHEHTAKDHEGDRLFIDAGIHIVKNYAATQCQETPEKIVQEFLEILNQT